MPYYVFYLKNFLELYYNLASSDAGWFVFSGSFFTSIILIVIADILSHRIDSNTYPDSTAEIPDEKKIKKEINSEVSAKSLVFKIILIIIFVFVTTQIFQWAISSTPNRVNF